MFQRALAQCFRALEMHGGGARARKAFVDAARDARITVLPDDAPKARSAPAPRRKPSAAIVLLIFGISDELPAELAKDPDHRRTHGGPRPYLCGQQRSSPAAWKQLVFRIAIRALLGAQFFSQFAPIDWSDFLAVDIGGHSKRSPPCEAMEPNPRSEPFTEFLSRHGDSLRQTVNLGNCGNFGRPALTGGGDAVCPHIAFLKRSSCAAIPKSSPPEAEQTEAAALAEHVLAASGKTGS